MRFRVAVKKTFEAWDHPNGRHASSVLNAKAKSYRQATAPRRLRENFQINYRRYFASRQNACWTKK
jgi:hypothetical protein